MFLFLMTYGFESISAGFTENGVLALNAIRCAMLNGFTNTSQLLAAAFLAAKQFTLEDLLNQYTMDEIYPYFCTC